MAKASHKSDIEQAPAEESKRHYEIIYRPGPQDPPITKVAGITFRANVLVKVAYDKTITAPIVKFHDHADGTVSSKAYETRIRIGVLLSDNPCFEVDGKPPRPRKIETARVPTNPPQYKNYAIHWIAESDDAAAMDARWEAEEHLRGICGVTDVDISTLRMFFDAKHSQCEGTGHTFVPQMPA